MPTTVLTFPVFSLRRIPTPFEATGFKNYSAIVEVGNLPDMTGWRRINVRDPKLSGALPRAIASSFLENSETFVFMNRGLVMAVDRVQFDNDTNLLSLHLSNPDLHGLLDGGHTYEIVLQNRDGLREAGREQYVKVEIIEGFDADDLVNLVEARNSSNQVKDESLMELQRKFDKIKDAVDGKVYADKIAYSEYEIGADGSPKPIDIREIVSFLMALDKTNFHGSDHPINAYRSKAACLNHFKANPGAFEMLYPLTDDILRLWDTIHLELPDMYNKVRGETGEVSGGRFGKLTGVTYLGGSRKKQPLFFLGRNSDYVIPAGFKYPILGAFRALLEERDGRFVWGNGIDPADFFRRVVGKELAKTIGTFALDEQNPSKTGKSQIVWHSCYQTAEIEYLRTRTKK